MGAEAAVEVRWSGHPVAPALIGPHPPLTWELWPYFRRLHQQPARRRSTPDRTSPHRSSLCQSAGSRGPSRRSCCHRQWLRTGISRGFITLLVVNLMAKHRFNALLLKSSATIEDELLYATAVDGGFARMFFYTLTYYQMLQVDYFSGSSTNTCGNKDTYSRMILRPLWLCVSTPTWPQFT